ncbi:uncharacterized protein LY79DRAFT_560575 [Colletotrichum navitas]|uniref:Uncharacterized protein n=1 Tax=Colletotrichum navitas TaxID=681940 RepID=A0AAD8PVR0_9PEZI|nr:uncharacterized protein LY79DRAFT_560575 [Colletotrichum navitas]KAK1584793.1 hypothetical protein LY79DRAFT_560575 [Colletotrichum navitas]
MTLLGTPTWRDDHRDWKVPSHMAHYVSWKSVRTGGLMSFSCQTHGREKEQSLGGTALGILLYCDMVDVHSSLFGVFNYRYRQTAPGRLPGRRTTPIDVLEVIHPYTSRKDPASWFFLSTMWPTAPVPSPASTHVRDCLIFDSPLQTFYSRKEGRKKTAMPAAIHLPSQLFCVILSPSRPLLSPPPRPI